MRFDKIYITFEQSKNLNIDDFMISTVFNSKGESGTVSPVFRRLSQKKDVYYPRLQQWELVK
jgi:hypothetical protein